MAFPNSQPQAELFRPSHVESMCVHLIVFAIVAFAVTLRAIAITGSESVPNDVVTMHSTVCLVNNQSGEKLTCTVVYPEDVELFDHAVSVLDPLGINLIGCEVGDAVECDQRARSGAWRIVKIAYQPEREGDLHR